ncbi:histone-lysine N-methyltransferase trithorax isoform X3 [Vibrio phage vB_VpS_PG07]|uniref:Histone-lysine N-methyltransferase trithorax isoform X3 n=1 Tax=Vibrio phage vB_VpS_PG07 TaxID=2301664 RepID=A0A385E6V4_9CAUD|nr:histone-lysine N-methyltransferase trithorax isoform X3 [Vibrio phage vB_VpS_PG07]AXQ66695.1 histone-lysine N-methyltransferase trithorax isoform X3 [Vibrio phage vB_VpS_PG07]
MQGCKNCHELLDVLLEECDQCGSTDLEPVVECVHCSCWVSEDHVDRAGLCDSQGNDCASDPDLVDEYDGLAVDTILALSKQLLR